MTLANKLRSANLVAAGQWLEAPEGEGFAWKEVAEILHCYQPVRFEITFKDGSTYVASEHERFVVLSVEAEAIPTKPVIPSWDDYFLAIAKAVALRGKCRRRQVGAVLVTADRRLIGSGYNGFPAGSPGDCLTGSCPRGLTRKGAVPPDSSYTDPDSIGFCPAIHSEANALIFSGESARGCTLYVTDKPCPDCSRLIAGAGVVRAVWPEGEMNPLDFYSVE